MLIVDFPCADQKIFAPLQLSARVLQFPALRAIV
jgi:hypothetical protein